MSIVPTLTGCIHRIDDAGFRRLALPPTLNARTIEYLSFLSRYGALDTIEIAYIMGVSQSTAMKDLIGMRRGGLAKMAGQRRSIGRPVTLWARA